MDVGLLGCLAQRCHIHRARRSAGPRSRPALPALAGPWGRGPWDRRWRGVCGDGLAGGARSAARSIVVPQCHAAGMKDNGADLARLLGKQHNVITRGQAFACGLTYEGIRHRLRPGGRWQRLLPGVYLAVTGAPTVEQRETAALLYGGKGSLLTGPAALRRHRLNCPDADAIDVLIPAATQRQDLAFARFHRTHRIPELHCAEGPLRWVLPARAVADTARGMTGLAEVRALTANAVQRGRCRIALLLDELNSGPMQGSALLRRALIEVAEGVRSAVEGELRDLIKRARLPMPMFNARLYVGSTLIAVTDCWWPDAGVAAEADSREWHISPDDWERTLRRHDAMSAHGIITLHFTPRRIRHEAASVAAVIRDALRAGQARPPLKVRAVAAAG
jgi:hypothetical protein